MTFSEVKQLLDAGFTKEEILAFQDVNTSVESKAEPEEKTEPEVTETEVKEPEVKEVKEPVPDNSAIDKLNDVITKLIKTIQVSNLQTVYTDKQSAEDITTQAENIMKSIIRPEKHN